MHMVLIITGITSTTLTAIIAPYSLLYWPWKAGSPTETVYLLVSLR